jgi:hypothetical protein
MVCLTVASPSVEFDGDVRTVRRGALGIPKVKAKSYDVLGNWGMDQRFKRKSPMSRYRRSLFVHFLSGFAQRNFFFLQTIFVFNE